MDDVSKSQFSVIILPVICGLLFIVAAFLEALLFEFLFFLGGVLAFIIQIPFIIKWCYKKEIKPVLLCIISIIIFFVLVLSGGYLDATLFYAT